MFNLVKNELTKIFSKKAIFIALLVFLSLSILVLVMQKYYEDKIKAVVTKTAEFLVSYLVKELCSCYDMQHNS